MSTSRALAVLAGRYRLEDWIATGGMGEVWRASDLVLHRQVAVKLLRAEYTRHLETLTRFRAEARHAGSLSHPGIAQIYDYGEASPAHPPFLVMELVDGPPLARLLAAGPLDPARAMDVVAQAAEGLDAAHAAGLVHRDVKPGNLLLAPGDRVKITDFGIARAEGSASITRTGMVIGTSAYLAPERVAGAPTTPASDLYSLGIVAYECLTGAPPFGGTALEIALAQQMRPLPPLPPGVPGDAAALIAGLTAKDPAARPATAREVALRARSLRDAMTGATWQVYPPAVSGAGQHAAQPAAWQALAPAASDDTHYITRPAGWQDPPGDAQDATQPVNWPEHASPTLADMQRPTVAGDPAALRGFGTQDPPRPARPRRISRAWPRRQRVTVLAVAAAPLIGGLAAWALSGTSGTAAPQRRPVAHRATTPPPRPGSSARIVQVNAGGLVGQPAGSVVQRLRQLGLQVHVQLVRTGQQATRTVVSVQPGGQVPAGSSVIVTVALAPPATETGITTTTAAATGTAAATDRRGDRPES